jgi:hypothetical protein
LEASYPGPPIPGMSLVLKDESPDLSHVSVEVYQATEADGGAEAPVVSELLAGDQLKVRLGRLAF